MKKGLLIVLVILILGGGWYHLSMKQQNEDNTEVKERIEKTLNGESTSKDSQEEIVKEKTTKTDVKEEKTKEDSPTIEKEVTSEEEGLAAEQEATEFLGEEELELVYTGKTDDGYGFEWKINTGDDDVSGVEWYLVRDDEENPEYNDRNYWYRSKGALMKNVVTELESGNYFFRVCESRDGECVRYSNNVELTIE